MILGISNIEIFRVFFDVVMEYKDTVELFANEIGVKVSVLSNNHSCFYEVFYEKDFFDLYEVDGNEVVSLFIEDMYTILKSASKNETLTLSTDDNFVNLKFEKEGNSRVFELVQAQHFGDTPAMPSLELPCDFDVDVSVLERTFKDIDFIKTNGVRFVKKGDELVLGTDETAQTRYNHTIKVYGNGDAVAKYSVNYLNDLVKFKKVSSEISVEFGDDMPFVWTSESDGVKIKGLIAPLLGEDE